MTGRTTLDAIFSGGLLLEQPARGHGYRFNIDALLLAREALSSGVARRALDLGAGCGVAGLALRFLGGCSELLLVEREPWVASLATRNAAAFQGASAVACAVEAFSPAAPFDCVLCNPPYTPPDEGRPCPEPRRAQARRGELAPFLGATARSLTPQGRAFFIYPTQGLPSLLQEASQHGLHPRRLRLVHATPALPARVALLELHRSGGPLLVSPPLFERNNRGQLEEGLATFLAGPGSAGRRTTMTDPALPSPPQRAEILASLCAGLLLPSETDAPLSVVHLPGPPTPETLREASGAAPEAPVEETPLESLFADLTRDTTGATDTTGDERADQERFRKLHTFFQSELQEARVWRVGQVEIEVWILGKEEGGAWLGVRGKVVET